MQLKNSILLKNLFELLPAKTQKSINSADEKSSIEFYKKVRQKGLKRAKYLMKLVKKINNSLP